MNLRASQTWSRITAISATGLIVAATLTAAGASGVGLAREQRLVGEVDAAAFGAAVAADGRRLVVGAPDTPASTSTGRVYVFERTAGIWQQMARISPEGSVPERFGRSVALDGRVIVVGAHAGATPLDIVADTPPGAAYVFELRRGQWQQLARLTVAGLPASARFGEHVAISGRLLAVAAPGADRVYVFQNRRQQWQQVAMLEVPSTDTEFGNSLAMAGQTLVVGSPGGFFLSSAYVFQRVKKVWEQSAQLIPELVDQSGFGRAVSIDGDIIAVGADNELNNDRVGAFYVYERQRQSWVRLVRLTAGGSGLDRFGQAIAVAGHRVIVGAPGTLGFTGDAAYLFERIGGVWMQTQRLIAGDLIQGVAFGQAVALSNGSAVVGSGRRNSVSVFD